MFNTLRQVFGSRMKAQEVLFLTQGVKPVVRQAFTSQELPVVQKYCDHHDIHMVIARFTLQLLEPGFSNAGLRLPFGSPGLQVVYLSKNELRAWQASHAELTHDDQRLGSLLGYPSCCITYFCATFGVGNTNPVLKPVNKYTNLSQRHNDAVLLSHFPCSSVCPQSLQLAKTYLQVLKHHVPTHAAWLSEQLATKDAQLPWHDAVEN